MAIVGLSWCDYSYKLLGWTQEEIAGLTGYADKSGVNKALKNGQMAKIQLSIQDWLDKGRTVEEAAEKLEIDAVLAWAKGNESNETFAGK